LENIGVPDRYYTSFTHFWRIDLQTNIPAYFLTAHKKAPGYAGAFAVTIAY
jgi:hypothetical protein